MTADPHQIDPTAYLEELREAIEQDSGERFSVDEVLSELT